MEYKILIVNKIISFNLSEDMLLGKIRRPAFKTEFAGDLPTMLATAFSKWRRVLILTGDRWVAGFRSRNFYTLFNPHGINERGAVDDVGPARVFASKYLNRIVDVIEAGAREGADSDFHIHELLLD